MDFSKPLSVSRVGTSASTCSTSDGRASDMRGSMMSRIGRSGTGSAWLRDATRRGTKGGSSASRTGRGTLGSR